MVLPMGVEGHLTGVFASHLTGAVGLLTGVVVHPSVVGDLPTDASDYLTTVAGQVDLDRECFAHGVPVTRESSVDRRALAGGLEVTLAVSLVGSDDSAGLNGREPRLGRDRLT